MYSILVHKSILIRNHVSICREIIKPNMSRIIKDFLETEGFYSTDWGNSLAKRSWYIVINKLNSIGCPRLYVVSVVTRQERGSCVPSWSTYYTRAHNKYCTNNEHLLDHLLEFPVRVRRVEVGALAGSAGGGASLLARLRDALDLLQRVLARRRLPPPLAGAAAILLPCCTCTLIQ